MITLRRIRGRQMAKRIEIVLANQVYRRVEEFRPRRRHAAVKDCSPCLVPCVGDRLENCSCESAHDELKVLHETSAVASVAKPPFSAEFESVVRFFGPLADNS